MLSEDVCKGELRLTAQRKASCESPVPRFSLKAKPPPPLPNQLVCLCLWHSLPDGPFSLRQLLRFLCISSVTLIILPSLAGTPPRWDEDCVLGLHSDFFSCLSVPVTFAVRLVRRSTWVSTTGTQMTSHGIWQLMPELREQLHGSSQRPTGVVIPVPLMSSGGHLVTFMMRTTSILCLQPWQSAGTLLWLCSDSWRWLWQIFGSEKLRQWDEEMCSSRFPLDRTGLPSRLPEFDAEETAQPSGNLFPLLS